MPNKHFISLVLTSVLIIVITWIILLFASGYRIDLANQTIQGTGIISISSTPDGGLVYINGVPKDATNTSITQLKPGEYQLQIEKEGYSKWSKTIAVKKELVTKTDALLIPIYPSLTSLTYTGAAQPKVAPDNQRVVYYAGKDSFAGLWELSFEELPFNIARKPRLLFADTEETNYSQGNLLWSPTGNQLLIEFAETAELYDFSDNTHTNVNNPSEIKEQWQEENDLAETEKLAQFTDETKSTIASLQEAVWSPDNNYILHQKVNGTQTEYYILQLPDLTGANSETPSPLPSSVIGNAPVATAETSKPHQVIWYPDSRHILCIYEETENKSTIEIVEVDGENRTQVFGGTIRDLQVFPNPSGSKIIALTKFNPDVEAFNLYAIQLR